MAGKKNVKRFDAPHQIVLHVKDGSGTVGTAYVKPNGVGWSPASAQDKMFVEWADLYALLQANPTKAKVTKAKKTVSRKRR